MRNTQPTDHMIRRSLIAAAVLALGVGYVLAEPAAVETTRPIAHDDAQSSGSRLQRGESPAQDLQNFTGTVQGYNLGAGGLPDALLIESNGKLVQVNLPPMLAAAISEIAPKGDEVKITGIGERTSERLQPDHTVFRLVLLTTSKGQEIGAPHSVPQTVHVDAMVKQLNFGRSGEVNGAILDSGDLLHLTPESAVQLKLAVGQKLSIDGMAHPMLLGHNIIAAKTVNGFAIMTTDREEGPGGPPDEGGPDGPRRGERHFALADSRPDENGPGPGGRGNDGPRPGSRERVSQDSDGPGPSGRGFDGPRPGSREGGPQDNAGPGPSGRGFDGPRPGSREGGSQDSAGPGPSGRGFDGPRQGSRDGGPRDGDILPPPRDDGQGSDARRGRGPQVGGPTPDDEQGPGPGGGRISPPQDRPGPDSEGRSGARLRGDGPPPDGQPGPDDQGPPRRGSRGNGPPPDGAQGPDAPSR